MNQLGNVSISYGTLDSGGLVYQGLIITDRTKRVREARDEAKKEIDAYKKAKDDEYKKFEAEVSWPLCALIAANCLK
jgi:V-type H+-transporting ATPase subunit G